MAFAATYLVFFGCCLFGAYLLDLLFPEFGFRQYSPAIGHFLERLGHSFLALLGVAALQYWFSVRWKSFILPVGIGLLGFIIATFLVFIGGRFDLAAYLPYAYPLMMGAEFGTEPIGLDRLGWLTSVEWFSIGVFALSSLAGFLEEKNKNVQ